MSVTVGDIHEVIGYVENGEQIAQNVLHFQVGVATQPGAGSQALADAYSTILAMFYKDSISANTTYLGASWRLVAPARTLAVTSQSGKGIGTASTDELPRQTSAVISLSDGTPTRTGRGRIYWPFPVEANNDTGGVPSAAYRAKLSGYMGTLLNMTILDGTMAPIADVKLMIRHNGPPVTFTPVAAYRINTRWGTQRRRGSYGRPNVPPQGL